MTKDHPMKNNFYMLDAALAARRDLPPAAKIIMAIIARHIGHNGHAWAGTRTIAWEAGVRDQTVSQNIVRLEKAGLLEVQRRENGRSNLYSIPKKSATETVTERKPSRNGNRHTGVTETVTEPQRKPSHNRITLNKTYKTSPVGFDTFWNLWPKHPRKAAQVKCRAMWQVKKLEPRADHVLAVLEAHKQGEQWKRDGGQFIPAPYQWLKHDHWDCDLADATTQVKAAEDTWEGRDPTEAEMRAWALSGEGPRPPKMPEQDLGKVFGKSGAGK